MNAPKTTSSIFFFPLRTNVEYFASPEGFLTLEGRIKQASLLYDTIICEGGMYIATIGHMGSVDMWKPPADITDEELYQSFRPSGGEYYFAVGPSGSKQRYIIQSGSVERRFRSEFHSLLKNIGPQIPEWIQIKTYGLTQEANDLVSRLTEQNIRNPEIVIPEGGLWLRRRIISNLNHDLILIRNLQSAASMDPLHMPILQKKISGLQSAHGFLSLEVAIPDFSGLSWEVIAEVRQHKAIMEFRHKMAQVESYARTSLPNADQNQLLDQISQLITDELLTEIRNLMPKTTSTARNVIINLLSGLLPYPFGTVPAIGSSIAEISKQLKAEDSWVTVFMRLRATSSENPSDS